MISITRKSVGFRHGVLRTFTNKARAGRQHLKSAQSARKTQPTDVSKILRPYREPEMASIYKLNPDPEEVDMFVHERRTEAVESEYRRALTRMRWAAARRSMEHGPQELNMLTAAQKAELRRLAADDPDHWRPQRLAAAFGVSTVAVKKLLKSRWQPATPQEIERHDRKVAARRKALGLPTPPMQPPPPAPPVSETASRPQGPMTALLNMFSPPPPVPMAAPTERREAVSAIYSRNEVLQFPVSDARDDQDSEMRKLDVPVNLPGKHMTLDELKRTERGMERKKKLKVNPRLPKI